MMRGLLLTNLGTPSGSNVAAVRSYLREFLTDKRVIDIPAVIRYCLVYGIILPFRSSKSAHAYQTIWTDKGSPLLTESQQLVSELQKIIGSQYKLALGMRYGEPSIRQAMDELKDCHSITILPLFPQYSSAATGSSIEEVLKVAMNREVFPSLQVIRDFYQNPAYIQAQAQLIKDHLPQNSFLLFSYHGIPERQIKKSGCVNVCEGICPPINNMNQGCYKAQCHHTTSLLARELHLESNQYSTAFQSRLGKTPWIRPYTDEVLKELAAKGIKNLTITCPSFVTDCLETLEEIGMRAREQWLELGGEQFTLIPGMNHHPMWIKALAEIIN
ncbi:MAG TPA: ferrochelatase [Legionella sp.]|nr:ferrochelatase [Legionella sp.]